MPAPSTIDVTPPFDPTAYASISGAQLLQLVGGLAPYMDKGFIIASVDVGGVPEVPDADATTKWQNYIWLRIGATSVTPYIWNNNATNHNDGSTPPNNILKWYTIASASIGVGTITTNMIADNAIVNSKIANGQLDYSKIFNPPSGLPPGGPATGDLTGTYPGPQIATNAITSSKILDGSVTAGKIADNSLPVVKLIPNAVSLTQIRTNAGSTLVEWFVPLVITNLANPIAGDSLKVVRVNVGETAYEKVATKIITQMTVVSGVSINATGVLSSSAHGLAGIPQVVRWVLVNTSTEGGYAVNDEVPIESVTDGGRRVYAMFMDATNVGLLASTLYTTPDVLNKATGVEFAINKTKWTAKCYAYYLS